MLQKVVVLALFGLVAFSAAMPFDVLSDISDCKLCEHIVGAAERHHHNNLGNTTQDQLKRELDRECFQFTHTHGDGAAKKCAAFVNANIATIYNDIKAGKRPPAVCRDLGLCGGTGVPNTGMPMTIAMTTMASGPKVEFIPEILAPHDPCRTCAFIVGRAEHHFKPNETSDQLKAHLEKECKQLAHLQGQQAADHCKLIIDNNIQTIYNDIKAGKRPHQICTDIGECGGATGMPPSGPPPSGMPKAEAAATQAPHDPCRTCAFIIGRAEHRFKPDETADQLKGHLERECKELAHLQGQQAADHCTQLVDTNIQTIYSDMKAGKRPHQICADIGECAAATGMPPSGPPEADPKEMPRPHDPCRTCEFIIGRAEHHIHNGNVPDEKRLLRELEHECIQLAHTEGDQASVACLNIVQKDIDMIYNDIKAGKRPRQICEDMGECQARTTTGAPPMTGSPIMMSTPPPSLLKKFLNIFH